MISISKEYFSEEILSEISNLSQHELVFLITLGIEAKKNISRKSIILKSSVTTSNPQDLGDIGEDYVEKILNTKYAIKDVSRKPHSGDMIMSKKKKIVGRSLIFDNSQILVEVKNYSNTVPYKEVEKFIDDLQNNKQMLGGLFISLKSDISTIDKNFDFHILFLGRSVPVIYLSSSISNIILLAAEILWGFIDNKLLTNKENDLLRKQMNKIYQKILTLSESLESLKSSQITLDKMKDVVNKSVRLVQQNLFVTETQIVRTSLDIKKIMTRINEEEIDKINENNKIYGEIENIINEFDNIVNCEYKSSSMNKDKTILQTIKKIISLQFQEKEFVTLNYGKNITIWKEEENKQKCCVEILPMKTKTKMKIKIHANNENISVPTYLQYDSGWLSFEVDKNFISTFYVKLERYLIQQNFIEKN